MTKEWKTIWVDGVARLDIHGGPGSWTVYIGDRKLGVLKPFQEKGNRYSWRVTWDNRKRPRIFRSLVDACRTLLYTARKMDELLKLSTSKPFPFDLDETEVVQLSRWLLHNLKG